LDDAGSVVSIAKRKLNRVLTEVPEKGTFDLEQVKQSTYFFS
jgi:DNA-directed RNA polymerase